jgi:threonine dehydrogenase-like Zn-dependent dehydrogenase
MGAMRALLWDGVTATVVDRPPPTPAPGWATVRVTRAGVCNTDLEIVKGYMDFRGVLGHELVGVVEDGPAEWRNKRVVVEINFACGSCEACKENLGRHCPRRRVMGILGADGAFADLVAVPVVNLREVPASIDDDHAVFVEPLAAAFEVLEQVTIAERTRCAVLGDGKLGLLVAQVLALAGADVLAIGKHEDKLAILRALGIATTTFDAWGREPAQIVVEATGTARGFSAAIEATRPRGTLVLKSTVADAVTEKLAPIVINEISVVGSRCGRFEPALGALEAGRVSVAPLVSARMPLAKADEALRKAAAPGVLKVLLEND